MCYVTLYHMISYTWARRAASPAPGPWGLWVGGPAAGSSRVQRLKRIKQPNLINKRLLDLNYLLSYLHEHGRDCQRRTGGAGAGRWQGTNRATAGQTHGRGKAWARQGHSILIYIIVIISIINHNNNTMIIIMIIIIVILVGHGHGPRAGGSRSRDRGSGDGWYKVCLRAPVLHHTSKVIAVLAIIHNIAIIVMITIPTQH